MVKIRFPGRVTETGNHGKVVGWKTMDSRSSPVTSRQTEPHPRLAETVARHAREPWRKPVADHSRRAFDALGPEVRAWGGRLILDTGCGTGMSTGVLARRHPDCLVIGVDKSEARLAKSGDALPANAVLVRADLGDVWLLAREAGWSFVRQCFFYPNPWPKPEHRLRRWAFHPALPVALACGGVWELRTNWDVYAQEWALAVGQLSGRLDPVVPWNPEVPETLFEKKYQASGHGLWRWVSSDDVRAPAGHPHRQPPPG